uniref:Endonuclease YncB, thermonuclease family n=1 Tax=Candidatus Kentrum sp. LFY TaxID=2126342 RepID=A0A450WGZ0_9GAMM|nr:MAG: Endonuclease YncB, thermonuclease family [Candidatus Kentron sp. LFY]
MKTNMARTILMSSFGIVLILAAHQAVSGSKNYGNVTVSELVSVYDGDTFKVTINAWPSIIGKEIGIRVDGVDTPEIRGKCLREKELARAAKRYTENMLRKAEVVELRDLGRGKYFRIVADVYADGNSLGKGLIGNGHAVAYDGGRKTKDWCK